MLNQSSPAERFGRRLIDAASRLNLPGDHPALDLAGRFGLRQFLSRQSGPNAPRRENEWLVRAREYRKEARDLSRFLTGQEIRHFFFKGIALIGRFYDIEERQLADIDLFVRPSGKNAALAALHALGYADLRDEDHWQPDRERPGVTMRRTEDGALLDVHWGLESVAQLAPTIGPVVPEAVWSGVETQRGLPVPQDEHHAALVLHHLVRHDLEHVRGLLDFALLWNALPHASGRELTEVAGALGVGRALSVVGRAVVDGLGLYPLRGVPLTTGDWRRRALVRRTRLDDLLVWAARRSGSEPTHVLITVRRAWWRFLLADDAQAGALLGEVFRPSAEYLRWRWPALSASGAWSRHLRDALGT